MINVTEKYHELVANKGIRKKKVNARKLLETIGKINGESGYPYIMNEDVVNAANPIDGNVRMSNLCVAPETNILTDKGDVPIVTKVDQEVNVWNGEEWSKVTVRKTGENQKLLTVKTSDGRDLDCTEYHKWYKHEGYGRQATITEVRTIDLEPGDKLIKWTPPVIEGNEEFAYPYLHGFISADGTMLKDDKARIYLYNKKLPLVQSFGLELKWRQGSNNRLEAETIVKYPKYTVPTAEYTIKSRLDWLAGWLDGDGSVYHHY
jgi:ribonucleoside-diphosphate reductase alpha chain